MSGMAHQLRWLPNAITIARLACLPVLLVMLLTAEGPTSLPAAIFFAALALTDLIDGALARALKATSNFGRIADPGAEMRKHATRLSATHVLPGCGHWTQQERPAEVNAILVNWLKGL